MADLATDIASLSEDDIERIERLTMRWLFQAMVDFGVEPVTIFRNSPDAVRDVAEDVTREVLDRLAGYNIQQRVFGNVDYKKARYVILPDQVVWQALFVDSKAEKSPTSARLQMSEISLSVRQYRQGQAVDLPGKIRSVESFNGEEFLTTTMLLHYLYGQEAPQFNYVLRQITVCAIPNGRLQVRYNPSPDDDIWLAGPHAPQRGEEFRVRLSFAKLKNKASWRVQQVRYKGLDTPEPDGESNTTMELREQQYLAVDAIYLGKAEELLSSIKPSSVACNIWSPPYHVGKEYERDNTYVDWVELLDTVVTQHFTVLKPGGFLAINIADILCFPDPSMPRLMAANVSRRKVGITKEQVLAAWAEHPSHNRYQIAKLLGCSEQTADRRLKGNNIRGGKYAMQTRVKVVGGLIEDLGQKAGLYLYDRRVWVKDPAWENSRWHTMSYRSVDEFEYIYIFWKPGPTLVDRSRLRKEDMDRLGVSCRLAYSVGARKRRS